MTEPLDNSKDSINELENTNRSEIDPNIPNITDDFHRDAAVHAKLYKLLRQVVSKSVAELKVLSLENTSRTSNEIVEAVPISFNVPEDCENVNTMRLDTIISEAQRNAKQRSRTNLVAEISVTFKIPDDFVKNAMDMGKFSIFQAAGDKTGENNNNNNNNNGCQFSFSERLEGWKIERRQRINGRFDLYYRHERSKAMFRSTIEVVNFLLYEAYPDKPKPGNDVKSEEEEESPVVEKSENTRRKCLKKSPNWLALNSNSPQKTKTRQRKTNFSTDHDACKEEEKVENYEEKVDQKEEERVETVEEFLDKAYKNFLNSTPSTFTSSFVYESDTDEEFEEFYAAFAYDQPIDENDEINDQTVEEFLESAYNNLLNYFNDDVDEPKVSSKNKRKRSDEKPKKEKKIRIVAQPRNPIWADNLMMEEKDIKYPKKVEANNNNNNPMEVDEASSGTESTDDEVEVEANPVETDPVKVEANNIATTNHETSSATKDEVVDNVVKVEAATPAEVEDGVGEASPMKVDEVLNPTEVVANPTTDVAANPVVIGANSNPDDVVAAAANTEPVVADDDVAAATGDQGISGPVEVKAKSDSVEMETGKQGSLVVLSSYSDQCDLINYIPLADNMFDIGIPLVNRRRNGDK